MNLPFRPQKIHFQEYILKMQKCINYLLLHHKLEKAMAPHSSTLGWKIPWMEDPGRLQSMGSRRVGHDWATSLSLFTFMHWRRNGNPLQCSCLENPRDGGTGWAAVSGVAQSRTQLKWLSSSITNTATNHLGLSRTVDFTETHNFQYSN